MARGVDLIGDLLLSLQRDAPVADVRVGAFWTAVVSAGCGLASTTTGDIAPHLDAPVRQAGSLLNRSARELADLARSASRLETTIGVAAINSLLEVDEGRCVELNAADLLEHKGRGRQVALVGHFPFVPRLRQAAARLTVLELRPQEGDRPAEEAETAIPAADVVAITGSALVNGTLGRLLSLCRPESLVVVLGPTTPLSPVLFDHGVDVISGTRVLDSDLVLRYVSQGASFRQMQGVRLLTMARSVEAIED